VAYLNLGRAYEFGLGVPPDLVQAAKWYRAAAEAGDLDGQLQFGILCQTGKGMAVDLPQAVKWYRLAAEQGAKHGQVNLAHMYKHGRGIAKDPVEAHFWYALAASRPGAEDVQGIAVKNRDELAATLTASQLEENERRVKAWKPAAQTRQK
jgi:hypothetical protein